MENKIEFIENIQNSILAENIQNEEIGKNNKSTEIKHIGKKIYMNRLFPKTHNINFKNLMIDDETMTYITNPYETKKIFSIIVPHINKYKKYSECSIVDATGGAGGDTITFCQYFQSVISIEIDQTRCSYLKNNIDEYKFQNCIILNGDSTLIVPKIQYCDVIYVDPPWGGKNYKLKTNLKLYLGEMELEEFVLKCFDKTITTCPPKVMVLKLPKNYCLKYLFDCLSSQLDIYLYELEKMNILIIERKNIIAIETKNTIVPEI
jgi:16S rRNA G966 N2-methylase RsmD